jgi:hypothetical protein
VEDKRRGTIDFYRCCVMAPRQNRIRGSKAQRVFEIREGKTTRLVRTAFTNADESQRQDYESHKQFLQLSPHSFAHSMLSHWTHKKTFPSQYEEESEIGERCKA